MRRSLETGISTAEPLGQEALPPDRALPPDAYCPPPVGGTSKHPSSRRKRLVFRILGVLVPSSLCLALALASRTPFPIVAVSSNSMAPVLHRGDLVFVRGTTPREIAEGEIILFDVPQPTRDRYGYPARIIHRVVSKVETGQDLGFQTKGDDTPPDPFTVRPDALRARYLASLPWLGYPVVYLDSRPGRLSLLLGSLIVFLVIKYQFRPSSTEPGRIPARRTPKS